MEKTRDDIESRCVLKNSFLGFSALRAIARAGFDVPKKHELSRILTRTDTKFLVFISLIFVLFSVSVPLARAADISFVPASGVYKVGDTFPVGVVIGSPSQAVNAASARILFPPSKLEVVHISKSASILDLWIAEPAYSNGAGTVDFEGIAFNPGYQGASGQVILITFRVKDVGSIPLSFSSASVLANDGRGTDVLSNIGSALFDIREGGGASPAAPTPAKSTSSSRTEIPSAPIDVDKNASPAPRVYSSTHPNPKQWYLDNTAVFEWTVPLSATGVRLLWGAKENALPTIYYDEPLNNKTIDLGDTADGTYYFHVQFRDEKGWSNVAHFQFNVDRTPPDTLGIMCIGDEGACSASFKVNAHDETAGISHFLMQIDNQEPELWRRFKDSDLWSPPTLHAGPHLLRVTAVDRAGNTLEKTVSFESVATFPLVSSWSLSSNSKVGGALFIAAGLLWAVIIFTQKKKKYPVSFSTHNRVQSGKVSHAGWVVLRALLLPFWWPLRFIWKQAEKIPRASVFVLRILLMPLWWPFRFGFYLLQSGKASRALLVVLRLLLLPLWWPLRAGFDFVRSGKAAHILWLVLRLPFLPFLWVLRAGLNFFQSGKMTRAIWFMLRTLFIPIWWPLSVGFDFVRSGKAARAVWLVFRILFLSPLLPIFLISYLYRHTRRKKVVYAKKKITKPRI